MKQYLSLILLALTLWHCSPNNVTEDNSLQQYFTRNGARGTFALLDNTGYRTIFYSWVVAFVFIEIIRIGIIMQDPFSNGPNDVPMSAICRNIEIDLRQMLGETEVPPPLREKNGVLM